MHTLPDSALRLIDELSRLPGIGKKTAQRLAFHLLNTDMESVKDLADSLNDIKIKIKNCSICHGITEQDPCKICNDFSRDNSLLCIVEGAYDIFVFEKINSFKGKYHVLGGALSPLDGVGPDASPERFRGIRIFDISNIKKPKQVGAVQTCRGSHTHSVVAGPTAFNKILKDLNKIIPKKVNRIIVEGRP